MLSRRGSHTLLVDGNVGHSFGMAQSKNPSTKLKLGKVTSNYLIVLRIRSLLILWVQISKKKLYSLKFFLTV